MGRGRKYDENRAKIDRDKAYPVKQGIEVMLGVKFVKFDETAEIAMNLGVDPRHADQNVRGAVSLPHGTGNEVRVIVFAKGDKAKEAEDAGADEVGAEELAKRIQDGWLGFDRVIATPDMMSVVGRLGRVLGPRGLMPNPKVGTVTTDVQKAVEEQKAGRIEFRVDKNGILHAAFGKASFGPEKLYDNLVSIIDVIMKAKPASTKGTYLKKASISTTMGPGVRLDPADVQATLR